MRSRRFAAGSILSAIAGSRGALIAGRIVQGAGAAALLPLSIALVAAAFPRARQPRAFGIWAAVSAIALGIGPLAGGLLIDLTWRLLFWINLPITALGAAIILASARETRDEGASHRIDVPGLLALSAGLAAAVLALVEANEWGWGSARTIGLFAAGLAMLGGLWLIEHRVRAPIAEFSLFRNGPYFGATAAAFAIVFAYWTWKVRTGADDCVSSHAIALTISTDAIALRPVAMARGVGLYVPARPQRRCRARCALSGRNARALR